MTTNSEMEAMDTAEDGDLGHDIADLNAFDTNASVPMAVMDVDGDGSKEGEDEEEEALLDEPVIPQAPMALMEVDDVSGVDHKENGEDQEEPTLDAPAIQEQTGDVDMTSSPKSHRSASMQQQLHPIEVVLEPPTDPASYEKIDLPSSWYVFKVLEQIDLGDEDDYGQDSWYSVEFDDGRVDQVSGRSCFGIRVSSRHISLLSPLSPSARYQRRKPQGLLRYHCVHCCCSCRSPMNGARILANFVGRKVPIAIAIAIAVDLGSCFVYFNGPQVAHHST